MANLETNTVGTSSEVLTLVSGPRYCAICGEWPARETSLGLRCHLCECREYALSHPVPLPGNRNILRDLASIGVPGAAEKLSMMPSKNFK